MSKTSVLFYLCFCSLSTWSQNLSLPIDYPISIAGNYAELRKNHFHMGLDFRTENKENLPILAVADGYVSRIVISPAGYGKALYVNHPQLGLTSVYAHLNRFRPDIEWWLNKVQYALMKNTLDTSFERSYFRVKRGEHIAQSGNTGSSEGPHLHFEVRNIVTEKTINPLHFYNQIADTIAPTIGNVLFYHIEGESNFMGKFSFQEINNQTIEINSGNVGLAISGFDKMNNSPNKLGLYCLRIYEDNALKYQLKMDSLSFDWQAHIRATSDYGVQETDVFKGFYDPCSFNVTDSGSLNGVISLQAGEKKFISIQALDFHGNSRLTQFYLKSTADYHLDNSKAVQCQEEHFLTDKKTFHVTIPAGGLAENYTLSYALGDHLEREEVFKIRVLNESLAALKPFRLSFMAPQGLKDLEKLYLETHVDGKKKDYTAILNQNVLTFPKIKNFGNFSIRYDKHPPRISDKIARDKHHLIFTANDMETGIAEYQLSIDGQWRSFYYDEKNNKFIHKILMKDKGKKVRVLFEVTDKLGNKNRKMYEILL